MTHEELNAAKLINAAMTLAALPSVYSHKSVAMAIAHLQQTTLTAPQADVAVLEQLVVVIKAAQNT